MAFPPSRYGTPSAFSTVLPKTIKQADPFKDYLNTLKCPVCQGQVDGVSSPFYCAQIREHYQTFINGDLPYAPYREVVVFYDTKFRRYQITQHGHTEIVVWDTVSTKAPITFDFMLFDFSNTTREKMLHRLRTILVFQ